MRYGNCQLNFIFYRPLGLYRGPYDIKRLAGSCFVKITLASQASCDTPVTTYVYLVYRS